jgi:catechol 2,3-dioxygenase-like lactoylglutathione lyase family enzyme
MEKTLVRDFKSIVLTSDTPDATAAFYREVAGLPLEEERHRGTVRHWACQVGSLHFAIHERKTFWLSATPTGEGKGEATSAPAPGDSVTVVSFTTDDLNGVLERLASRGVEVAARTKIGPMSFVAVRDPDGRHLCFGTPWPDVRPR